MDPLDQAAEKILQRDQLLVLLLVLNMLEQAENLEDAKARVKDVLHELGG